MLTELAIEKTLWEPEASPHAVANISCFNNTWERKNSKKNKKAQSETLSVADAFEK